MRILLSCLQSDHKHPIAAYGFWETYFKLGLEEAGVEWLQVPEVDWAKGLTKQTETEQRAWREEAWSRTVDYITHTDKNVDLFLSYLFPEQIDESAIATIQKLGIPCVNFFCDNVREFTTPPKTFRCFDLHWVPEYQAISMYQDAQLPYLHLPMPMWIPPQLRTVPAEETFPVTFVGSCDKQRKALFADVLSLSSLPIEIRGRGWDSPHKDTHITPGKSLRETFGNQLSFVAKQGIRAFGRKLADKLRKDISLSLFKEHIQPAPLGEDDYFHVLRHSLITLGVNRFPSYRFPFHAPGTYSRLRDLEAPMLGACYLTEWTEGLDQLYSIGEEIETYRTAEEMAEKIKSLSSDQGKRNKLRAVGQKRALAHHTLTQSIAKLSKHLGIRQ